MDTEASVAQLLRRYREHNQVPWDEFIPVLYDDLRRLAHQRLRHERPEHTLGTTALVNECFLRLVETRHLAAEDRNGFLAIASQTMRRVLVDYARTRNRGKRSGSQIQVPLEDVEPWLSDREAEELLLLDAALEKLRALDARAAEVVQLRFFGGLSAAETAEALGLSEKTVQRTWVAARAWLRKEVPDSEGI